MMCARGQNLCLREPLLISDLPLFLASRPVDKKRLEGDKKIIALIKSFNTLPCHILIVVKLKQCHRSSQLNNANNIIIEC